MKLGSTIPILLLLFAVVVFALVAFTALTTDVVRWEAGAFAAGFGALLPWGSVI